MKLTLRLAFLLVLVCATIVATLFVVKKLDEPDSKGPNITSAFVEQQINEISELATLHHHYRKNANYQDAKKLLKYMPDWRINQSVKQFGLVYHRSGRPKDLVCSKGKDHDERNDAHRPGQRQHHSL